MPDPQLRVDPLELLMASEQIANAAGEHATQTAGHQDELTDAASRWRGDSQSALRELAERWQEQDTKHQEQVTALTDKLSEAAQRFASIDALSREAIASAIPVSDEGV